MCHDNSPRPVRGGDAIEVQQVTIPLTTGALPTSIAFPERRPAPAILVIHDVNGVNGFYREIARRLAFAGYIAVLPDLFFRQEPLAEDTREAKAARRNAMEQSATMTDIESTLIWLRHHEHGSGEAGVLGFCMGGTLAMLAASRDPVPAAAVAYYGFPSGERTATAPILPSDEDEVANIQSPLLAFWGTDDAGVGMGNVDQYEANLQRYDKTHEFVRYPGIGHGFLTFDPDEASYSQAEDSWTRTLRFFDERLTPTVTA